MYLEDLVRSLTMLQSMFILMTFNEISYINYIFQMKDPTNI